MNHGTYSKYTTGKCRCEECKAAAKSYREAKKGTLAPGDERHGTTNGYYSFGCRCEPCRAACQESRNRGLPKNDPRHGTVNGYSTWGCRCSECKAAIAKYARESGTRHKSQLKALYGITPEQWDELFESQEGRCASCGDVPPEDAKRRFHVDHDHSSGAVRGILCHSCNVALGHLKEEQSRIQALSEYLAKWKPF